MSPERAGFEVREARAQEHGELGQLMVSVYAGLEGFPKPQEMPHYFEMLSNIGDLAARPGARLLVAVGAQGLLGGVVHFADMAQYGSGGTATRERNAAGFRLLAVDAKARGLGVGRALMEACIEAAKAEGQEQVIIHTTEPMKMAWAMYEKRGFKRSLDLDFLQGALPVYGFRLDLASPAPEMES